jgi:hypothetical protein
MMCHRAIEAAGFRKPQIGAAPAVHLERARDRARLRTHLHPALYTARYWKLAGMLIGASPDCGPQPGGTSPALGWSVLAVKPSGRGGLGRGRHGRTSDENMSKWTAKHNFLRSCLKFKKIRKKFLQE